MSKSASKNCTAFSIRRILPEQDVNIRAVIRLYEEGKIDGIRAAWVMEGKLVTEEEAKSRPCWAWREVGFFYLFPR
jgi:hypothetical protein